MKLYNTKSRKIESFKPVNPPNVTLYTCGPTVYDYIHIGNLRTYTNNDILKRTLMNFGFNVRHVMNITDVGHLTGDDDSGEDKIEISAKKMGKSTQDIASFFTDFYFRSTDSINILRSDISVKATDVISDIIDFIKKIQKKGYAYETNEALYFDISNLKKYGVLSSQKLEEKRQQARSEVHKDVQKKHPADFALWLKTVGRFKNHIMHWSSPWGEGFPGWHIECSVIATKYLGSTIDIHAGGIDHIPVHHENEIAQSEVANGKKFVKYWFHNNFLVIDGRKMSKSLGNITTIDDIKKKGFDPLSLRYLFLQTHYRQQQNFTWKSLESAQNAYKKLKDTVIQLQKQKIIRHVLSPEKLDKIQFFSGQMRGALENDLQIPKALSIIWEVVKSNIPSSDKLDFILEYDNIFGLKLSELKEDEIPNEIISLAKQREKARNNKQFTLADTLRRKIEKKGFIIKDGTNGFSIKKSSY